MGFGYTSKDLIQLVFKTNKGQLSAYGGASTSIIQTPLIAFKEDGVRLFGFNSRMGPTGQLTALSMIAYEASCMEKFTKELGDDFEWTERAIPVRVDEPDSGTNGGSQPVINNNPKVKPSLPAPPVIGPVQPEPEP